MSTFQTKKTTASRSSQWGRSRRCHRRGRCQGLLSGKWSKCKIRPGLDGGKSGYACITAAPLAAMPATSSFSARRMAVRPFTNPSTSGDSVMDAHLGWSPDGTKIAFLSYADQSKVAILTLADSSIVKPSAVCSSCNGSARFRSWSPDGTKILIEC